MSCCNNTDNCSSNVPETCEALPLTNAASRLVVEDEANCKRTIQAPTNPSVLTQTAGGNLAWSDGSDANPVNLTELKDSALMEGLVGKNSNGDLAQLVHTPAETEDEIALCDATGWKVKTASEIFGTATGVAVRVAGGPATWVNGLPGQLLGIGSGGDIAFTNSDLQYGTTAQRPVLGIGDRAIYFNTTLQVFEWWNGTFWMTSSATRRSDEIIQTFTSSQTFTVPAGITNIAEVLVVGGGGGGGFYYGGGGGGGGGGGVLYQLNYAVTPGAGITVTIGAGGAARTSALQGGDGGTSVFGSLSAIGGGGGGCGGSPQAGRAGGSGGGGGNTTAGGAGTALQGSSGGNSTTYSGGGGGGAGQTGAIGSDAASGTGGAGGIGRELSISGVPLFYGGGGGGAGGAVGGAGSGTSGGGGNGGGGAGLDGTANTGGGGGGGQSTTSGAGGSGIVIIKY